MAKKVTNFSYDNPTIINAPVRIDQNKHNYFYRSFSAVGSIPGPIYEQRILTSSTPLNPLLSNKNNHVGYGVVTESWDIIGSTIHYFTTPINFQEHFTDDLDILTSPNLTHDAHSFYKSGAFSGLTFNLDNISGIPAALQFPENSTYMSWLLGVEYQNEIKNADNEIRQSSVSSFEIIEDETKSLFYMESEMYQFNFPGSFAQQLGFRLINEFLPFGGAEFQALVDFIVEVIGGTFDHPFKRIERHYFENYFRLNDSNFRPTSSTVTDYLLSGSVSATTVYDYSGTANPLVPKSVTTNMTPGGQTTASVNIFLSDTGEPEMHVDTYMSHEAITFLQSYGFNQPIATRQLVNGDIVSEDFTGLKTIGEGQTLQLVPWRNATRRNGVLSLAGEFSGYNSDGKPGSYRLARYGTQPGDALSNNSLFFQPIVLTWNPQLQLATRGYQSLITTYDYDETFFVLIRKTDPDLIITEYSYDELWRLKTLFALNSTQTTGYTYNVAPGNNFVKTETTFNDGTDMQSTTAYLDGFGRSLKTVRSDGAELNSTLYDDYFRVASQSNITSGLTLFDYEHSPIPRFQSVTDAVGNVVKTEQFADNIFYTGTLTTDPNLRLSKSLTDGLGRVRRTMSGALVGSSFESVTRYEYNNYGQPTSITNPVGETFTYTYNDMSMVKEKQVPGSGLYRYWYDENFRLAASRDAKQQTLVYQYDIYNRVTNIYLHTGLTTFDSDGNGIVKASEMTSYQSSDKLVESFDYPIDHTWSTGSKEKILTSDGGLNFKRTSITRDLLGRITSSHSTYPAMTDLGEYTNTINNTWNDAGLVNTMEQITDGPQLIHLAYDFNYDQVLRPIETTLNMNAGVSGSVGTVLSHLEYNSKDLIKTKYLGESAPGAGFLQKVDYLYDAAGKLTHINTPGESECKQGSDICTMRSAFKFDIETGDPDCPGYLSAIQIGSQSVVVYPVLSLANTNAAESLKSLIQSALDQLGYIGDITVSTELEYGTLVSYKVTIANTDAPSVILKNEHCDFGQFDPVECCTIDMPLGETGPGNPLFALNPDLFSEALTFTNLDITRIEYGSDCTIGKMRNEFTYDENHRVRTLTNTMFNPDAITGRYDEVFDYDPAGNIKTLTRNGHIGNGYFNQIDDLKYTYTDGQLTNVTDYTTNLDNQPFGFKPASSTYQYDDNGNLKSDDGKRLLISYNVLNLPIKVRSTTLPEEVKIDYTFGGEKIRKRHLVSGTVEEDRLYVGGIEYVNGKAETYSHPEGRIQIEQGDPLKYKFQYKIADHLGDMAVFFEDSDNDGIITTEDSDPANSEVLQRHFYYSFGMEMEGDWVQPTAPENRYQYNGKELNEDLGLDWYDYGARWYDAAVGRWGQVDPMAEKYYDLGTYSFAGNVPTRNVEEDGAYFTGDVNLLADIVRQLEQVNTNSSKTQLANITRMRDSDIEFNIQIVDFTNKSDGIGGETSFDFENNRVVLEVYNFTNPNAGKEETTIEGRGLHEIEHGRQFMDNEVDYFQVGSKTIKSLAHDQTDEYKAFCAQAVLNVYLDPEQRLTDKRIESLLQRGYSSLPPDARNTDYPTSIKGREISEKKPDDYPFPNYQSGSTYVPTDNQKKEKARINEN